MEQNAAVIPSIIDDIRRIFQIVSEYARAAEKVSGLTGPQLWALKLLGNSSPQKVSELARNMYLHPATVVGILNRLEAKGLVTRTRSLDDRRVVDVELTDEGAELVRKSPQVAQAMLVDGLAELTAEQLETVAEGVSQVVKILGAEHLTPRPLLST